MRVTGQNQRAVCSLDRMRRGKPLSVFKTGFELSYFREGLGSGDVNNTWRKLYII